jgi:hypothetical protein
MRIHRLVLLLLVSGCSLYFGDNPSDHGHHPYPPDAGTRPPDAGTRPPDAGTRPPDAGTQPPDAGLPTPRVLMARCEDGKLFGIDVAPGADLGDQPGHGAGFAVGACPGACRSAAALCTDRDCSTAEEALCEAPISVGATCSLAGASCTGAGTINCPETTACSEAVPGSSCTCTGGAYRCTQVTPVAEIQAQLVGKWHGTVTPPAGFPKPWPITLWIYPDGTYWAACASNACVAALWFESDGPTPDRKITVLSASETVGAWADIGVGSSPPNIGELSGLIVNSTTLRFTFTASYFNCGQPFDVTLARD